MALQYRTGKPQPRPALKRTETLGKGSFAGKRLTRTGELVGNMKSLATPTTPANHAKGGLAYRMQGKKGKW